MAFGVKSKKEKEKKFRHIRTGKIFNPKKDVMIDKNYWIEVKEKKAKEKKTPKTRGVFVIKGDYGHGFEDETEETSYWGAKNRLKEYKDNMPNVSHRLVRRRVPYFELSENDRKQNFKELEEYDKRVKMARMKRQQRDSPQVTTTTWLGSFKTE